MNMVDWKHIADAYELHDERINKLFIGRQNLDCVKFVIKKHKRSGLIVAQFIMFCVMRTPQNIHEAKLIIQESVDCVKKILPPQMELIMYSCRVDGCDQIVTNDIERYCSAHHDQHRRANLNNVNIKMRMKTERI